MGRLITGSTRLTRRTGILLGGMALGLRVVSTIAAENTVTLRIVEPRPLHAFIMTEEPFRPIEASGAILRADAELRVIVRDDVGAANWSVSLASSDFRYTGDSPDGEDLANDGFRILTIATAAGVGQLPAASLPFRSSGSLDTPRTIAAAGEELVTGDYSRSVSVELDIPASGIAGDYLATLTVAITSAP